MTSRTPVRCCLRLTEAQSAAISQIAKDRFYGNHSVTIRLVIDRGIDVLNGEFSTLEKAKAGSC